MPNHLDIRIQRLDTDVIDAEAFERELKIQGAVTFRRECAKRLGGKYKKLWTDKENRMADFIHEMWRKGKGDITDIMEELPIDLLVDCHDELLAVIRKMQNTDENLLNMPVPCLSRDEQAMLLQYRDRKKTKTPTKPKFDVKRKRESKSMESHDSKNQKFWLTF